MVFASLGSANGLPQSTVEAIFQDGQGYIWFGTHQGADRFDGYEFVNFHHEPQNPRSLRGDVVYAIAEDLDGGLWFGTQSGLDRLDPETGDFLHVNLGTSDESSGRNVVVTALLNDDAGDLWVGTHVGIFHLARQHGETFIIRRYVSMEVQGGLVDGILVASLHQDSAGEIWAGTQHGLARYSPDSDSFARVPATTFTASSAITQPARQAEFAASGLYAPFVDTPVIIQSIVEVKPGLLLLGGEGLTLYNTRDHTAFPLDISEFADAPVDLQSDRVWSTLRDRSGTVWIGLDAGLARFDPSTYRGAFVQYTVGEGTDERLVLSMLQDAEGNLWLGTPAAGVFVHQPARQKFSKPALYLTEALGNANVWSVVKDRRGFIWLGTDTGILRVNRLTEEVQPYPLVTAPQSTVYPQSVRAIVEDQSANIWAGTANGKLFLHKAGTDEFVQQFPDRLGTGYPINALHVDRDGDLWIATNNGLYWHRPDPGGMQHLLSEPSRPDSLCHNRVLTIKEDASGKVWLGTWAGICSIDKQTGVFSNVEPSTPDTTSSLEGPVFSMLPDGSSGLWLAGQAGELQHLDLSTGETRHFSDPGGATVGLVYSILGDDQGRLWLSTQQGLSSFDPEMAVFVNYSRQDGLPLGKFNMGAYSQGPDGELFFGGRDGLVSFLPGAVPRNPYVPPIVVTQLTQSGAPLATGTGAARERHLALTWPGNYFEFEFAALSYAKSEDNQYAYFLEGVDPGWVFAGKSRRGRYVNLPGGDYVLHLSGSNNDGLWNSDGAEIRVTVVPPLWQRRAFQAAAALALMALAFVGYRYRVRSIVHRSRDLESLVQKRTSELTGINEELRQVVSQRRQAEQKLAHRIAAEAVMNERNRLARDLHDAVTQTIFSASILSETLPHVMEANPSKARQQIDELQRLTQGALAELRSLLLELRPEGLIKTDLADLLGQLCRGIGGRSGIPVELACDLQVEVPSEIKVTLYRIAQEALNNASRHADPARIRVECSSDPVRIRLRIVDDGKGFDNRQKAGDRMGLNIMAERAADIGANLTVTSHPGGGTQVLVDWLFPGEAESDERR
jgi:signal transduction histidine kinase/ligand-binding sensor domain-containing protein